MRVLVTGARGKVGRALCAAGSRRRGTTCARPISPFRPGTAPQPDEPEDYWQADLTDAGSAYALARDCDAVVHTAAIPQPIHNPPHVVFGNNIVSTFNVLEAAIAGGVRRFVNFSSETVSGIHLRPATASSRSTSRSTNSMPFGPRIRTRPRSGSASCCATGPIERSDLRCTSIRPSWVQDEASYERNLGPIVRDPVRPRRELLLVRRRARPLRRCRARHRERPARTRGVLHRLARHDRRPSTRGDRDDLLRRRRIEFRPVEREDASAVSSAKARRLLGWSPTRSWRDYLDDEGRVRT